MANKRKRDDLSDSDSDEITPGRQILPVANLPHDFDQEPQDGMQYLFLVRRDARRLPRVTRVQNPYEVPETKLAPSCTLPSTNVLPCEEWRVAFQAHFSNLRKNLTQATTHVHPDHSGSRRRVIPEKKDRDAWWKFLAGHSESAWSTKARPVRKKLGRGGFAGPTEVVRLEDRTSLPGVPSRKESSHRPITCTDDSLRHVLRQSSSVDILGIVESTHSVPFVIDPSKPSEEVGEEFAGQLSPPEAAPSHLREIDHRMAVHLLMYFTHWINIHLQNPSDPLTTISVSHGRWIFALLTKVEDQLSADEMNLLRNLARACLRLIHISQGKLAKENTALEEIPGPAFAQDTTSMSDASCWMVFTAVAGHWGQRDLWADAKTTLAGV